MWLFFWGTVPCVPAAGMYVYYNPTSILFWAALASTIFFCFLFLFAVRACYPHGEKNEEENVYFVYILFLCFMRKEYITPFLKPCFPKSWQKHVSTDWLILSWVLFLACLFSDLICDMRCFVMICCDWSKQHIYFWLGYGLLDWQKWYFSRLGACIFSLGHISGVTQKPKMKLKDRSTYGKLV